MCYHTVANVNSTSLLYSVMQYAICYCFISHENLINNMTLLFLSIDIFSINLIYYEAIDA